MNRRTGILARRSKGRDKVEEFLTGRNARATGGSSRSRCGNTKAGVVDDYRQLDEDL